MQLVQYRCGTGTVSEQLNISFYIGTSWTSWYDQLAVDSWPYFVM